MKKRILSGLLCLAMTFALMGAATAVESPTIYVNGQAIDTVVDPLLVNRTTYVSPIAVVRAMYPDTVTSWEDGQAVLRAEGLTISYAAGNCYLVANGRYLYFPGGVIVHNDELYVPARTLAKAMGAVVEWNAEAVYLQASTGPILPGDQFYNAYDLDQLAHIIHAESGNQPLEGMIAVGNVVMNRVADPAFPNNIHAVVYQRNQFTPVQNGTINLRPTAKAILAAKLVLDGANTAGNSMYFVNYHYSSWATRNRPYVATIGEHAFYS